ncbi:MAG: hypothetical protein HGA43_15145 [Nitrospirae bacterium]|nr:hypothetical protein [Nitrospirota bacterium]
MKRWDPGAGDTICHGRRLFLLSLAALALESKAARPPVISPVQSIAGARLLRRAGPTGMPENRPDSFGAFTMFVFPLAVAATPMDLYIADPGLGALFRYDPSLDVMAAIPGARITQQSRIAALADGSVIVANGTGYPARRFSRSGAMIQSMEAQASYGYFDEVVADPASGRFYGLDRVQGQMEELMPHGRGATLLPPGLLPDHPNAIAMDSRRLYVSGRACGCVMAIDLFGSRGREIVADDLGNVTGLAAGEGWLAILDSMEQQLRIYRDGILRADPAFSELRLINPQGMSLSNHMLYIADPGARTVATFRLRP